MISTSIKKLDELLGGGIKSAIITDVFGADGTGKTQLTMQISANCLQEGGNILYQDTTAKFRPERMLQILKNRKMKPDLLEKMTVSRVTNTAEQINYLTDIKENNFSLVVIDNITDLFSFEYAREEQYLEKHVLFMKYMHLLSLIALEKKIPIVITNMIRQIGILERENLDTSISMFTHLKIKLVKKRSGFIGEVLSPFSQRKEFSYLITNEGLSDVS